MTMQVDQAAGTTAPAENTIDYDEMERVYARDIFKGIISPNNSIVIERPKHRCAGVPTGSPTYIPDLEILKNALMWFCSPMRPAFFHGYGPTGSGKTEFWTWFCDKMNWPLAIVSVNPSLRPEAMQGRWVLKDGETIYVLGPVAHCMKYGGVVLLDEADTGSKDFIAKLHLPSEMGKSWLIEDTGETITPHKNYRFVTLGNTAGCGDISGLYPATQRWSTPFRNRAYLVPFDYLKPADEEKAIYLAFPHLKQGHRHSVKLLLKFANAMRDAMLGSDRKGQQKSSISVAFSTRALMKWVYYICCYGKQPPRLTLDLCFLNGVTAKEKADIEIVLNQVFNSADGHFLDEPFGWYDDLKTKQRSGAPSANGSSQQGSDEVDVSSFVFEMYRFTDSSSDKVWGWVVEDCTLYTVAGATKAAKLRLYTKVLGSNQEAQKEASKRLKSKLHAGYSYTENKVFTNDQILNSGA